MACPICGGGGEQFVCLNPKCDVDCIACMFCVEIYEYKCPECGGELWDQNAPDFLEVSETYMEQSTQREEQDHA